MNIFVRLDPARPVQLLGQLPSTASDRLEHGQVGDATSDASGDVRVHEGANGLLLLYGLSLWT